MTNSILNLIRPNILNLKAYVSARSEVAEDKLLYLDANENPYNLSSTDKANYYSNQQPTELISKIADIWECETDELIVTRGGDEAIDLIIKAVCEPNKDSITTCTPTFGMYKVLADINSTKVINIPLNENFQLDIEPILEQDSKIIFICSPNNPTGNLIFSGDIFELAKKKQDEAIILIDEAYIEFAQEGGVKADTYASFINKYPNIAVMRTLSKAYALAGERCGGLVAHRDLIKVLLKMLAPYPISRSQENSILEVLNRRDEAEDNIQKIIEEKNRVSAELNAIEGVNKIYPSATNFILVEVDNPDRLTQHLKDNKIIIRNRNKEVRDTVRISISSPQQNDKLLNCIRDYYTM